MGKNHLPFVFTRAAVMSNTVKAAANVEERRGEDAGRRGREEGREKGGKDEGTDGLTRMFTPSSLSLLFGWVLPHYQICLMVSWLFERGLMRLLKLRWIAFGAE